MSEAQSSPQQLAPATVPSNIPSWDMADRMRKALRHADIKVGDMADYLGVGRNTVSTWINGRITPSTQTLRLFSMRCGVPFEWLVGGIDRGPDTTGGQGVSPTGCNGDAHILAFPSVGSPSEEAA